ncbi:hypothetical protein GQ53DRAFT_706246 [Thozetella sp. PMI_491]|nr:hypothetical protein GQ53DRAFT_706246 [Thozetella sp. PMI_491]
MAPVTVTPEQVEHDVDNVIQDLYQVMVQVANYDQAGRPSKEVLADQLQKLSQSLQAVHSSANSIYDNGPRIPEPLIAYVENGRNPDIYTREFVELVRRMNQLARGKMHAFADFRDVLAHEMESAMPELRDDVKKVVLATGGPGDRGKEMGICGLAPAPPQQQPPPPSQSDARIPGSGSGTPSQGYAGQGGFGGPR